MLVLPKLLHHSQHAKNKLNSLTHSADFRVSRTKWLRPILTTSTQKWLKLNLHWIEFEFASTQKKSVHFINSVLRYSQFQIPVARLATPISDHAHPKTFWLTFNLCEFVSTCKKSGYFTDLLRYGWLKNPAIWLAKNILAHISGTKIFPNIGSVQNTANNINFHYRSNSEKINDQIF